MYVLAAFTTYMLLEKAAKTTFVRKIRTLNVDEIDTRNTSDFARLKSFNLKVSFFSYVRLKVSISSSFYEQLFNAKVFLRLFSNYSLAL